MQGAGLLLSRASARGFCTSPVRSIDTDHVTHNRTHSTPPSRLTLPGTVDLTETARGQLVHNTPHTKTERHWRPTGVTTRYRPRCYCTAAYRALRRIKTVPHPRSHEPSPPFLPSISPTLSLSSPPLSRILSLSSLLSSSSPLRLPIVSFHTDPFPSFTFLRPESPASSRSQDLPSPRCLLLSSTYTRLIRYTASTNQPAIPCIRPPATGIAISCSSAAPLTTINSRERRFPHLQNCL